MPCRRRPSSSPRCRRPRCGASSRSARSNTSQCATGQPDLEAALLAAGGQEPTVARAGQHCGDTTRDVLDTQVSPGLDSIIGRSIPRGDALPVYRIMDPSPFTVVEDMPAPRLYALFAKAGESAVCVTSIRGEIRGIISRTGLIAASRHHLSARC
mmetsp:Transcript_120938/g.375914  ORF Transcript_120938/g.375914 Transcript_120938/m.375914 type:complete len:155 (-) Transcript_120938:18-482(-)